MRSIRMSVVGLGMFFFQKANELPIAGMTETGARAGL